LDRNLLLAFALSFLVLSTWSMWQEHIKPPPSPEGTELAADLEPAEVKEENPPEASSDRYAQLPEATPAEEPSHASEPVVVRPEGETLQVEQELYTAELDTVGAGIRNWELADYTDHFGDPIVLTTGEAGSLAVTPFIELGVGDLSQQIWEVEGASDTEVAFRIEREGVGVRKIYRFQPGSYAFRLRLEVENGSARELAPRFMVDWPSHKLEGQDFREQSLAVFQDGKTQKQPITGLGSAGFLGRLTGKQPPMHYDYPGEIDWAGMQSPYFLAAAFPDSPAQASARITVLEPSRAGAVELYFDPVRLPPGQQVAHELRAYLGPKERDRLEALGSSAVASIDVGWSLFAPLTRGFGWLLEVIYSVIPNYGFAIIILTVLVRAVTAPLTVKQMRSMERMRRVQPRMKEIQEKHADDRQKQSEELMRLYKQEKVNPLGGCFPMILQLPVFIGLFYALRSSIHLRGAPFILWIDDLSAPDMLFQIPGVGLPLRVLPLVMGVSMVIQQKITPMQTPDPNQARMMMTIMPVVMTVLFYQFPSGLVLYWMVSNLLAIGHQLWIGRSMQPAPEGGGSNGKQAKAKAKAA
jgi:YidC/Oxa1 family membrane protein insertase